jgi:hypothetical protein
MIYFGHAAGADDEGVLTRGNVVQSYLVASSFRSIRELDRFPGEQLVCAVVDGDRRQTGQVGGEQIHTWVVPIHSGSVEPRGPEELQQRP